MLLSNCFSDKGFEFTTRVRVANEDCFRYVDRQLQIALFLINSLETLFGIGRCVYYFNIKDYYSNTILELGIGNYQLASSGRRIIIRRK